LAASPATHRRSPSLLHGHLSWDFLTSFSFWMLVPPITGLLS
jgi:hypothetical protein